MKQLIVFYENQIAIGLNNVSDYMGVDLTSVFGLYVGDFV